MFRIRNIGKQMDNIKKTPKYIKIKEEIKTLINKEDYKIGENIPGENALCKILDASKVTVHKALRELQEEGYLKRKRGIGTIVIKEFKKYNYDLTRVGRLDDLINKDSKIETKMLRIIEKKAGTKISGKLGIKKFEKVIEYSRLRSIDDITAVYSIDNIAKKIIPSGISIENIGPSLSKALDIIIDHSFSRIIPIKADLNTCGFLNIPPESLCLLLEEVTYDEENRPID